MLRPKPPVNCDVSSGLATALSHPLSFAWTPSVARASGNVPRCSERRCMSFLIDARQPGTTKSGGTPRILIPVSKLGKRNTSFRYKRNAVTIFYQRSTWWVWLNIFLTAVAVLYLEFQDYVDFCVQQT